VKTLSVRILVVEDEEEIIDLLYAILDDLTDCEVLVVRDGEEALRVIQGDKPDIVLLDIQIPKLNGYELCKVIKTDPNKANMKIVMLSGMTQICDKSKAQEVGADDFITKPFTSETLIEKIEELLK
jgi:CheY-like chemotaxis protein